MNDIKVGVIGLHRGRSFIRICSVLGGMKVTAVHDIDAAALNRFAGGLDAFITSNLEDFLNQDFEVAVVASPLPFHAQHVIAALRAGKHVLSEVTACSSLEEAKGLVEAVRSSDRVYMMAENYRYFDEVELVRRLHQEGAFGDVYYGEGEYVHDCQELWRGPDGGLTWRGRGGLGVYCTHSLGPLLYILGDSVASVSSMDVAGGKFDPEVKIPTMHVLHLQTRGGALLRVRVDHVSPRPHGMAYYSLQGTQGAYEGARGFGDRPKLWLSSVHEPSRFAVPAEWHSLMDEAPRLIPERLAAPEEARSGGHGTSEYWLIPEFLAAVRGERAAPIDVFRALDYTLPGIAALESAKLGGTPVSVPDPRDW
ncbi:MAG: Gfo/Idh/MocA family oxidoreductase [Acidimicrobiaceae bacterium]|nr:Gfo/Idh/MocA family oxidoreductase [Acidimicrobiaceae bacterium]